MDKWSPALRYNVNVIMHMTNPVTLYWGESEENIYNAAFKIIAQNRHPSLLGASFKEGWPEVYEYFVPLLARIRKGETVTEGL